MAKEINAFPWVRIEELFTIKGKGASARGVLRDDVPATFKALIRKGKGIYLLGATSAKSPKALGPKDVVYIGEAGGIGDGSTFEKRVAKHYQKALGHHNRAGGPSDISISKRWLDFIGTFKAAPPTERMYLRLLELPGSTNSDKARITELEHLLMCYWSNVSTGQAIERTLCNTSLPSSKRQRWYFSGTVESLGAATAAQPTQVAEEISEDAEMDFRSAFVSMLDQMHPALDAGGFDISRRGDRRATIWVRQSHVAIELEPLVRTRLVRLRKRDRRGSPLVLVGDFPLPEARRRISDLTKIGKS